MERTKVLAAIIAAVPPVLAGLLAAAFPTAVLYLALGVAGVWIAAVVLWEYYRISELGSKLKESEADRQRLRVSVESLAAEKMGLSGRVDELQRDLEEARSVRSLAFFPVETRTKSLSRNDSIVSVQKWWPAGQRVRVRFVVTDTTDIAVRCFDAPTEIPPDAVAHMTARLVWGEPGVKGWFKEFDTTSGLWFFMAGRPAKNVLDPTVTITVEELRRAG